jgi:hypothetical protein
VHESTRPGSATPANALEKLENRDFAGMFFCRAYATIFMSELNEILSNLGQSFPWSGFLPSEQQRGSKRDELGIARTLRVVTVGVGGALHSARHLRRRRGPRLRWWLLQRRLLRRRPITGRLTGTGCKTKTN